MKSKIERLAKEELIERIAAQKVQDKSTRGPKPSMKYKCHICEKYYPKKGMVKLMYTGFEVEKDDVVLLGTCHNCYFLVSAGNAIYG